MKTRNLSLIIVGLLICSNLITWLAVFHVLTAPPLKVVFFDIGQGDAIFVEISGLYQILIDGGPSRGVLEKLSNEMPFWDKSIDLVILSHPEKDHMEGLVSVLEQYRVDNILWTGVMRDTAVFKAWQESLEKEKQEGVRVGIAQAGQKITFQRTGLWELSQRPVLWVLYPFENLEGTWVKDSNKTSIVAKLDFGETSFLFTGDIYDKQEKELVAQGSDLEANILKLAHHGSKTSTSEEFLINVSPQIAVACVGKNNSYGHPHQEIVDRLDEFGIKLLRTDQNGDIKIESNGEKLIIKSKNYEGFRVPTF